MAKDIKGDPKDERAGVADPDAEQVRGVADEGDDFDDDADDMDDDEEDEDDDSSPL